MERWADLLDVDEQDESPPEYLTSERRFSWTAERVATLRRLRDEGRYFTDIARVLGCSKEACRSRARKLGMQTNCRLEWDEQWIAQLKALHAAGWSFKDIGAKLGCSRNAAIGKANRLGLLGEGRPRSRWTPDMVERLKQLAGERLYAHQIAVRLGVTKSAVETKLRRALGWKSPPIPSTRREWRARRSEISRTNAGGRASAAIDGIRRAAKRKPTTFVTREVIGEPASLNLDLFSLTEHTCKWPQGDATPYRFCGHTTERQGRPYCQFHEALSADQNSVTNDRIRHRRQMLAALECAAC